ncbi:DnaB-like helicase C-terminal domain-containing protein [Streptomyces sp. NEAU-Y11]|uniref:DnaB-like helicase C-terminal domain-containing protein n=1 Tax=Streptomyces cucumeris TaxID=2962890 RepID=UPI0020C896D6|nr:DnaB-like helicase C-terminal domain-containing protein [Streptomyces sp. NEAU-Y11]MCP9209644.1 hypothetical protein [Streptomyces sp. NEAU-Y11]
MSNVTDFPGGYMALVDEATEGVVLSALLNGEGHPLDCREEIVEVIGSSGPKVFTIGANQVIYEAVIACLVAGTSTSPPGVTAALRKTGGLTHILADRIGELASQSSGAVEAVNGARVLRDLHRRRTISQAMDDGASLVRSGKEECDVAIADAFGRVAAAVEAGEAPNSRYERDRLVEEGLGVILGLRQREPGLLFGLPDIDERTTGMHSGDLTAIGARSGDGKTIIGQNIARYAGKKQDTPTVFFSLEMAPGKLLQRCASAELAIPHDEIRSNNLSIGQRERIAKFAEEESENRNYRIEYVPGATAGEIYLLARKAVRDMGAKLFVIDYAQCVQTDRPIENMNERMSETVSRISDIPLKLGAHVILLSQLKKPIQGQEDRAPGVNDLLYGTKIENVASTILLLQRHLFEGKPGSEASVHTVKNRNGTLGENALIFDGERMRYLPASARMTGGPSW